MTALKDCPERLPGSLSVNLLSIMICLWAELIILAVCLALNRGDEKIIS